MKMRKIITIVFLLACSCSYGQQSIELFYNKEYIKHDDTIAKIVPTVGDVTGAKIDIDILNTSADTIKLKIIREIITLVPGAENYFCSNKCYEPEINDMEEYSNLIPNDTLSRYFYTVYSTNGQKGVSLIKYTFYDMGNMTDRTSVYLLFDSETVGIKENVSDNFYLEAYPNPATGKVVIKHRLQKQDARLLITNVMGMTLKSIPVNPAEDKTLIDVSDLASGIYFYSLEINGKISVTKKLIIK